jgi:hypothetical protein
MDAVGRPKIRGQRTAIKKSLHAIAIARAAERTNGGVKVCVGRGGGVERLGRSLGSFDRATIMRRNEARNDRVRNITSKVFIRARLCSHRATWIRLSLQIFSTSSLTSPLPIATRLGGTTSIRGFFFLFPSALPRPCSRLRAFLRPSLAHPFYGQRFFGAR